MITRRTLFVYLAKRFKTLGQFFRQRQRIFLRIFVILIFYVGLIFHGNSKEGLVFIEPEPFR